MVFAPPQHGKSELVSRRLPAFTLGRNPDAKIIATSYGEQLATAMNRDVQRIIDSPAYARLFPDTRLWGSNVRSDIRGLYMRNTDVFEVVGHAGSYRSSSVGKGITGHGATHGLIDDPIKGEEQAYSATYRESLRGWYDAEFRTRLRETSNVLVTLTRWHRKDLAGRLLEQAMQEATGDQWEVLDFEAIRTDAPKAHDPRQPGEPLWPDRYSLDYLRKTQAVIGPTRWAAMYQQSPRAEGGAEWPESFFGSGIWFDEWPADIWMRTMAWDPSKGKGAKWGDYSAVVQMALSGSVLYVDAVLRNDRPIDQLIDEALDMQRRFKADAFGVESNQFQELLGPQLVRRAGELGVPCAPYLIDNRVNKEVRIRRLTSWLSTGQIRFKGGSAGARLLVEQLRDFPNGDHDDGPDALEMAIRLATELGAHVDDGLGNNLFTRN